MMARMTPVSLHFSDVPTGWGKNLYRQTTVGYWFCMFVTNTVSPDEHCYRLICASCTQFHVPLGTQAFQLPQAASKQMSVPWCCRCGMFAAFTTAAIRLLRSIFIWAPPRTRPKFQHLCAHTRDSQRSRCSARRCNISRLPLSSKHVLCFWLFFDIFQMMMTKVWYCHGHDLCPASRDLLRCPAIVWLVWIAGFLVGTAAIGKKGSVPWCCKLHASRRSRRKHPQRYNEPNSLVTSTTSCTNLLHTRTIQCKEFVLRSLRPRLLRLTSKHHCRIDMQTEQWSSLWTYQFPHKLPHQTNRAPHVLARMH